MRTLKLGIAGVDPACPNKGVEALAYSALYLLRELECELDCRFDLFLICDNRKLEQCTLEIGNCRCQLIRLAPLNFRYWKNAAKTLLFYLRHPDRLGCWLQLDAVLDAGLGDSFSDLYGMRRFREINDPKWWLRLLRIPELMLPQTVGPFQSPRAIRAATRSLRAERAVLTRDRQSSECVRKLAPDVQLAEVIDLAFFLPFERVKFPDTTHVRVGLGISALLWNGGYTRGNQFQLASDYQEFTRKWLTWLLARKDLELYLVPHVPMGNDALEDDYNLAVQLAAEYGSGRLHLAPFFQTPIEAKNFISGLDFFAGSRMHACIAAYSSGVPVFPLAYSRKFNGLFSDTLGYPVLGDLVRQSTDELIAGFEDALNRRVELQEIIARTGEQLLPEKRRQLQAALRAFLEPLVKRGNHEEQ